MDGLGIGGGYTINLVIISAIREFLGTGQLVFGSTAFPAKPFFDPAVVMLTPPGGFVTLGLLMAILNIVLQRSEKKKAAREAAAAGD